MDVKAEHFERQVARVEAERDAMEKKVEAAEEKYAQSKRELDEVSRAFFCCRLKGPVSGEQLLMWVGATGCPADGEYLESCDQGFGTRDWDGG